MLYTACVLKCVWLNQQPLFYMQLFGQEDSTQLTKRAFFSAIYTLWAPSASLISPDADSSFRLPSEFWKCLAQYSVILKTEPALWLTKEGQPVLTRPNITRYREDCCTVLTRKAALHSSPFFCQEITGFVILLSFQQPPSWPLVASRRFQQCWVFTVVGAAHGLVAVALVAMTLVTMAFIAVRFSSTPTGPTALHLHVLLSERSGAGILTMLVWWGGRVLPAAVTALRREA